MTGQESKRRPGKLGSGPNESQAAGQVSNVTFLLLPLFLTLEPRAEWGRVFLHLGLRLDVLLGPCRGGDGEGGHSGPKQMILGGGWGLPEAGQIALALARRPLFSQEPRKGQRGVEAHLRVSVGVVRAFKGSSLAPPWLMSLALGLAKEI